MRYVVATIGSPIWQTYVNKYRLGRNSELFVIAYSRYPIKLRTLAAMTHIFFVK